LWLPPDRQRVPAPRVFEELGVDPHHALAGELARVADVDRDHLSGLGDGGQELRREVVGSGREPVDEELRSAAEDAIPHDPDLVPGVELQGPLRRDLEVLARVLGPEHRRVPERRVPDPQLHFPLLVGVEEGDPVPLDVRARVDEDEVPLVIAGIGIGPHAEPELDPSGDHRQVLRRRVGVRRRAGLRLAPTERERRRQRPCLPVGQLEAVVGLPEVVDVLQHEPLEPRGDLGLRREEAERAQVPAGHREERAVDEERPRDDEVRPRPRDAEEVMVVALGIARREERVAEVEAIGHVGLRHEADREPPARRDLDDLPQVGVRQLAPRGRAEDPSRLDRVRVPGRVGEPGRRHAELVVGRRDGVHHQREDVVAVDDLGLRGIFYQLVERSVPTDGEVAAHELGDSGVRTLHWQYGETRKTLGMTGNRRRQMLVHLARNPDTFGAGHKVRAGTAVREHLHGDARRIHGL
jgi:hypothetical protein